MIITRLRAQNLRKISNLSVEPGPRFNIVWGANGGGKTSFLESIYLLNAVKSFRTNRFDELVSHGQTWFGVAGEVAPEFQEEAEPAAIRIVKERDSTRITVNQLPVTSAASVASRFPLLVLEPHSFDIVEGGPRVRRSLLDRSVFHVEPDFVSLSRAYMQALSNRNALLRSAGRPAELDYWSRELAAKGEAIDETRRRCVDFLNEKLSQDSPFTSRIGSLGLRYRKGWRDDSSLLECLQRNQTAEAQSGQTLSGPHKAELVILSEGHSMAKTGSRGQLKALVFHLVGSLAAYIYERSKVRPVMLVDDFSAEFDDEMRGLAIRMLRSTCAQVFLTTVHEQLAREALEPEDLLFHVEQGSLLPSS